MLGTLNVGSPVQAQADPGSGGDPTRAWRTRAPRPPHSQRTPKTLTVTLVAAALPLCRTRPQARCWWRTAWRARSTPLRPSPASRRARPARSTPTRAPRARARAPTARPARRRRPTGRPGRRGRRPSRGPRRRRSTARRLHPGLDQRVENSFPLLWARGAWTLRPKWTREVPQWHFCVGQVAAAPCLRLVPGPPRSNHRPRDRLAHLRARVMPLPGCSTSNAARVAPWNRGRCNATSPRACAVRGHRRSQTYRFQASDAPHSTCGTPSEAKATTNAALHTPRCVPPAPQAVTALSPKNSPSKNQHPCSAHTRTPPPPTPQTGTQVHQGKESSAPAARLWRQRVGQQRPQLGAAVRLHLPQRELVAEQDHRPPVHVLHHHGVEEPPGRLHRLPAALHPPSEPQRQAIAHAPQRW